MAATGRYPSEKNHNSKIKPKSQLITPMNKGQISNLLRKLRLIYLLDRVRFNIEKFRNRNVNRKFKKENPDIPLPPDYLIYESFQINYTKYFTESCDTAKEIAGYIQKHIQLKSKKILDWGCGPGRVIRHLPEVIGNSCAYFGTDYNEKSIEWCSKNLPGIEFNRNSLEADLPYNDNFFDVIYGISIFTHLSKQLHFDWFNELLRVLKPGGIMFLTTQGYNYRAKLLQSELEKFDRGEVVIRGNVKEGHRTYSAFQPKDFMLQLFEHVEILEHIETEPGNKSWLPQDIWMVRK